LDIDFKHKYEFIRISSVLEHVLHPEKFLNKISSLLEENGECQISIPNTNSIYFKLFGKCWTALDVPRHLHGFSDGNIKLLAEKQGLKVEKMEYAARGSFSGILRNSVKIKLGLRIPDPFNIFALLFLPVDIIANWLKLSDSINVTVVKK